MLTSCSLMAQSRKAQDYFRRAQQAAFNKDIDNAQKYVNKALKEDSTYAEAWILQGDIYEFQDELNQAVNSYKKALRFGSKEYVYYKVGTIAYRNGMYEDAMYAYREYLKSPDLKGGKLKDEAIRMLRFSIVADSLKQNPVPFNPTSLGKLVNIMDMQYFPSISADGKHLIFTGRNFQGNDSDEDFYETFKENDQWGSATKLKGSINTPGNEGAMALSANGKYLFFVVCEHPNGYGSCDIFYSKVLPDGSWTEARNLGENINSRYWESQPSLSPDGKTLYFVRGGNSASDNIDIYFSTLSDEGYWTKAAKLPGKVNTNRKEGSPFIHFDNNTLYFASDGHPGMGANDLFISRRQPDGTWGEPVNIGYPINTSADNFSLIVAPDGRTAFYSSGLDNSSGKMDLMSFDLPEEVRATPIAWVKVNVVDAETNQPVRAKLSFSNLESRELLNEGMTTSDGSYYMALPSKSNYALTIEAPNYVMESENFTLESQSKAEAYDLNIALNKIKSGSVITLNNVFFDYNSYELRGESEIELNRLVEFLNNNPTVKISVEGHTDNAGNSEYNKTLSKNRAKSVVDFLVKNGIDSKRVQFKGFGDTKPIATNDTEEGRQKNRRTEVIIL